MKPFFKKSYFDEKLPAKTIIVDSNFQYQLSAKIRFHFLNPRCYSNTIVGSRGWTLRNLIEVLDRGHVIHKFVRKNGISSIVQER